MFHDKVIILLQTRIDISWDPDRQYRYLKLRIQTGSGSTSCPRIGLTCFFLMQRLLSTLPQSLQAVSSCSGGVCVGDAPADSWELSSPLPLFFLFRWGQILTGKYKCSLMAQLNAQTREAPDTDFVWYRMPPTGYRYLVILLKSITVPDIRWMSTVYPAILTKNTYIDFPDNCFVVYEINNCILAVFSIILILECLPPLLI